MQVVGICRFSLVGRGDWKAYQGKTDAEIEAIALEQAKKLFEPARMEARLTSFEHLTLASIAAQTDPDFIFVVLASDLMPLEYRVRLDALCARVPQVVLRYFPLVGTADAQLQVMRELGLKYGDTLQFRLDDDDCVCTDYIEMMKRHAGGLAKTDGVFVASLRGVLFSCLHGPMQGIYDWPVAFFSAGAAMRHPSKSIFAFGHFGMSYRFPALTIPGRMALVTHVGNNDTDVLSPERVRRRGMRRMEDDQIRQAQSNFFPFLTERGVQIAGIASAEA